MRCGCPAFGSALPLEARSTASMLRIGFSCSIRALLIPVDRLQLLLQGDERTVHVLCGGGEFVERFVIGIAASRHKACTPLLLSPASAVEKCPCQALPEPPTYTSTYSQSTLGRVRKQQTAFGRQ